MDKTFAASASSCGMVPSSLLAVTSVLAAVADPMMLAAVTDPTVVGFSPAPSVESTGPLLGVGLEFVASVVVLGLIGWIVRAIAPDFTADGVAYVLAEPGEVFLYGLLAGIAVFGVSVLLAITVVGVVILIPGLIVLAILGLGGTTVAMISLGSWIRSALGTGPQSVPEKHGQALSIGVIAWAAIDLVPVLGGLITFVIGTMGFGYLALWLANGRFDRDYGSFDGGGPDTSRNDEPRDDSRDRAVGGSRNPTGPGRSDPAADDPGRFRNLAALDAERERTEDERMSDGRNDVRTDDDSRNRPDGRR